MFVLFLFSFCIVSAFYTKINVVIKTLGAVVLPGLFTWWFPTLLFSITKIGFFSLPIKFGVEGKQAENRSETHYTNAVCMEESLWSGDFLCQQYSPDQRGLVGAELTALWSLWSLMENSRSVWTTLWAQGEILGMPCAGPGVGFEDSQIWDSQNWGFLWVPPNSGCSFVALCFNCVSSSVTKALTPIKQPLDCADVCHQVQMLVIPKVLSGSCGNCHQEWEKKLSIFLITSSER